MARNGADAFIQRNSKLEAFLKRNLAEETFEAVRAHEPVVVCSKKEDKAFKFVILTDDWIYLTENPPKKVAPEVHLGNIVSIKLVNDFPEFLSGAERENTQHILIKYMSQESGKGKGKKARDDKANTGSLTGGNLTYRSSLTARSGKSPWLERKTQSLKEKHNRELPEKATRRSSIDAEMLRDALEKKNKTSKKKRKKKDSDSESVADNVSLTSSQDLAATMLNRYSSSRYDRVRSLPRPLPNPSEEFDENGLLTDRRPSEPLKLNYTYSGELKLALEKLEEQEDDSLGDEENREVLSRSSNKADPTGLSNDNNNLSKSSRRRSIFERLRKSSVSQAEPEEEDEEERWHTEELHLYILNFASPMLMLIRASWNNYLIRETMQQDLDYLDRTTSLIEVKKTASEKFGLLFAQLKTELLHEATSLEEMFGLVNELKMAAERNFILKKLFWKTPELFLFFVKQLQMYLPNSPSKAFVESDEDKHQRADELEYVVLLLEMLALMFRETEILPNRLQCLWSGQGKSLLDLVVLLVCEPQLLDLDPPPRPRLIVPSTVKLRDWERDIEDTELYDLVAELNVVSTTVLSELILIAHQANWGDDNGKFLNLSWLLHILDELTSMESFITQVVVGALKRISPTNQEELLPADAVMLFHQFTVLQTMIEYSPNITNFITNNFYEEFKYFVQGPVILAMLPKHFPIADATIGLIEEVMTAVLGKSVSLVLNNALT